MTNLEKIYEYIKFCLQWVASGLCTLTLFIQTAWPIKVIIVLESPWEGELCFYENGPWHMTKMATMPIYMVIAYRDPKFSDR